MMGPGDCMSVCKLSPHLSLIAGSCHLLHYLGQRQEPRRCSGKAWSVECLFTCRRKSSNNFIQLVWDYSKQSEFSSKEVLVWEARRDCVVQNFGNQPHGCPMSVGPLTWSKLLLFGLLLVCGHRTRVWLVESPQFALTLPSWMVIDSGKPRPFNMNGTWFFSFFSFFFCSSKLLVTFITFRLCELWVWKETVLSFFSGEMCSSLNKLPREFLQTILSSSWKWPLTQSEKILISYIIIFGQLICVSLILTHIK